MKQTKRTVIFHGFFAEKYSDSPVEIFAENMHTLFDILYKCAFPQLMEEKAIKIAFEDTDGNVVDLFDENQQLSNKQTKIHILPNPDGAYAQIVYAIIMVIVAVGAALLLTPKVENTQQTASGANWESPENVIGQGGVIPVVLGETLAGSRVASYGIDSTVFRSTLGGGGSGGSGGSRPPIGSQQQN